VAFSQGLQDLEAAAAGEHQVQQHQVEDLGIGLIKAIFASPRHHHVIVLTLQSRRE
jgi:hypothetical protein